MMALVLIVVLIAIVVWAKLFLGIGWPSRRQIDEVEYEIIIRPRSSSAYPWESVVTRPRLPVDQFSYRSSYGDLWKKEEIAGFEWTARMKARWTVYKDTRFRRKYAGKSTAEQKFTIRR